MAFDRSIVKKFSPSVNPDWDSIDNYNLTQDGCFWKASTDVPASWMVCRYCGHTYNPSTVSYEAPKQYSFPTGNAQSDLMVAIHEPDRLIPERQLLEGDCPRCGE